MKPATPAPPRIILVDDEPEILFSFEVILRRAGLSNILSLTEGRKVLPALTEQEVGVIALDLQMPGLSGRELLAMITEEHPEVPVVIVTAANQTETAIACMKAGAFDYLVKPVEANRFVTTLKKALEIHLLHREISSLKDTLFSGRLRHEKAFAAFSTRSASMMTLFRYVEAIAPSDQPVLITGETGVGKELIARALHDASGRQGPFVAVNSGGLDDLMFSDTLFGHKKGAYTGAGEARDGMLAKAAGGTLFLDEVGDLSPMSQVKLLRLLQEGEYYPLGADVASLSTARIVVATNRDLETLQRDGSFRKDLYFRLRTHHAQVPPLRKRREDLPLLLASFLEEASASLKKKKPNYPPELLTYLNSYDFPGNLREFRALVFDAVARHRGGVLSTASFRSAIGGPKPARASRESVPAEEANDFSVCGRFPTLEEMEGHLITEALRRSNGNQGAAAALLGISRQALNKRLRRRNQNDNRDI